MIDSPFESGDNVVVQCPFFAEGIRFDAGIVGTVEAVLPNEEPAYRISSTAFRSPKLTIPFKGNELKRYQKPLNQYLNLLHAGPS